MKRKYFLLTVFLLLPFIFLSCSDNPSEYLNDGIKPTFRTFESAFIELENTV